MTAPEAQSGIDYFTERLAPTMRTIKDVVDQPELVGSLLAENCHDRQALPLIVQGTLDNMEGPGKTAMIHDILGVLVTDGTLEISPTRFPRLQRALGRLVIGNSRYKLPKS